MNSITTHILDTSLGGPARGLPVALYRQNSSHDWELAGSGATDEDGRITELVHPSFRLTPGNYRIIFDTATYFLSQNVKSLYLDVVVTFEVLDTAQHYHIPLLLSPHGYTTYRGS